MSITAQNAFLGNSEFVGGEKYETSDQRNLRETKSSSS
jgi:hypothetical protein